MSHIYPGPVSHMAYILFFFLACCAVARPAASQPLRSESGPYELEVLVNGVPAQAYGHGGETHILGHSGQRYVLRVHNRSGRRVEAVVTVDGLDVMDGKPGDVAKRGYLVPAYGHVDIEGFRLSQQEAAAFRFAAIEDSYAAKTGHSRNVGVIGVAVFSERRVQVAPRPRYSYRPRLEQKAAPRDEAADLGEAEAPADAAPKRSRKGSASLAPQASSGARADADAAHAESAPERRGLGTEFGEAVSSAIREVRFVRERPRRPQQMLGVRYNDRAGLIALGIDVDGPPSDLALRQSADPFPQSSRSYAQPPMGWER